MLGQCLEYALNTYPLCPFHGGTVSQTLVRHRTDKKTTSLWVLVIRLALVQYCQINICMGWKPISSEYSSYSPDADDNSIDQLNPTSYPTGILPKAVLLNFVLLFFIHLKPELLTQFPASNDEKINISQIHWGETGLANAGVSLSKMDASKVGRSVFCFFEVLHHNFFGLAIHPPYLYECKGFLGSIGVC